MKEKVERFVTTHFKNIFDRSMALVQNIEGLESTYVKHIPKHKNISARIDYVEDGDRVYGILECNRKIIFLLRFTVMKHTKELQLDDIFMYHVNSPIEADSGSLFLDALLINRSTDKDNTFACKVNNFEFGTEDKVCFTMVFDKILHSDNGVNPFENTDEHCASMDVDLSNLKNSFSELTASVLAKGATLGIDINIKSIISLLNNGSDVTVTYKKLDDSPTNLELFGSVGNIMFLTMFFSKEDNGDIVIDSCSVIILNDKLDVDNTIVELRDDKNIIYKGKEFKTTHTNVSLEKTKTVNKEVKVEVKYESGLEIDPWSSLSTVN